MPTLAEIDAEIAKRQGVQTRLQQIDAEIARRQKIGAQDGNISGDSGGPGVAVGEQGRGLLGDVRAGAAEFASGINRQAAQLIDALGPKPINDLLQMMGSEYQLPTVMESVPGMKGGFMEEGLARDIVRAAGEVGGMAVAPQMALRKAAAGLPAMAAGAEGTVAGLTRQAAQQTLPKALATGTGVGAGAAVGGEVGEALAEEEGRQVGELVGGLALPLTPTAIKAIGSKLSSETAKWYLKNAAPTTDALKDASQKIYKEIDDAGAVVKEGVVTKLSQGLKELTRTEGFNKRMHPNVAAALDDFAALEGARTPCQLVQ